MRSPVGPRGTYVSRALGGSLPRENPPGRRGRADSLGPLAHRRQARSYGSLPAAGRELRGRSARERGPRSTPVRAPRAAGTKGSWRPRAAAIKGPPHVADRRGAGYLGDSGLSGPARWGSPLPVAAVAAPLVITEGTRGVWARLESETPEEMLALEACDNRACGPADVERTRSQRSTPWRISWAIPSGPRSAG